jgi:hypothetical protein
MRTRLNDPTMLEYDDPVRLLCLSKPVRNDQRRPTGGRCHARPLQLTGTRTTGLSGRLVQYCDRRISKHQTGEGDLLSLRTGQLVTALAHNGLHTVR